MSKYTFCVTDNNTGTLTQVVFTADDIWTVLGRVKAFLQASEFPFVDEVIAVSHDPEDDTQDLYYYSDGTTLMAEEIDELNEKDI